MATDDGLISKIIPSEPKQGNPRFHAAGSPFF